MGRARLKQVTKSPDIHGAQTEKRDVGALVQKPYAYARPDASPVYEAKGPVGYDYAGITASGRPAFPKGAGRVGAQDVPAGSMQVQKPMIGKRIW